MRTSPNPVTVSVEAEGIVKTWKQVRTCHLKGQKEIPSGGGRSEEKVE